MINKVNGDMDLQDIENIIDVVFIDYINKYIDFTDRDFMTNKLGKLVECLRHLLWKRIYALF